MRVWPPCRAQREEELRAYKATRTTDKALLGDSADVSDRQPVFLKDKGDALYAQGNYRWVGA
jgi:dyslexia susceptibility 1 candidate gene 1 protein